MRILLAALILSLGANAFAQGPTQNYEEEAKTPARAQERQAQAAQASDEASRLEATEADMSISYDQILAHPDDVELNYRYARAQIARGELKAASATLERILLINPDLARVRLLYAVVLLRLDNLIEAQQELETLQALPMPDSLRQEIEQYLALIKKSRKRTHLSGSIGLGFENDDNRNATPSSGRMLFLDTPVNLVGTSGNRHDDTAMLFLGNIGVVHDLGYQEGHTVNASYSYYRAEQTNVKQLNLQAHSFSAGGTYRSPHVNVSPSLLFDHVLLAQATFLRDHGMDWRFDRAVSRTLSVYMDYRDVLQEYVNTQNVGNAVDRNGAELDFTWGADAALNAKMKLGVGYGYSVKNANKEFYSYNRNTVFVRHEWLLPRGMFLLSSACLNYDQYDQPEYAISVKNRRDTWGRVDATFGAPLSLIHPVLKDLAGTLSYEYFQALSTLTNYAYTNNKIIAMLTYRWDAAF